MTEVAPSLQRIDVFAGLPEADLGGLARRCAWKEVPAGREIVGHQDGSREVFFLVRGKVRANVYSIAGKQVTFRDIHEGEMFGEFAAIDGEPRSASVEALEDSTVAAMSPELFWEVLERYPQVTAVTLKRLTRQVRALSERVFEFSTLAVRNRIHAELLRLCREQGSDDVVVSLCPAPTHAEIASRISTHREAVTRELNALAHSGLLERRAGRLIICDVPRLTRMVQEVLGD